MTNEINVEASQWLGKIFNYDSNYDTTASWVLFGLPGMVTDNN